MSVFSIVNIITLLGVLVSPCSAIILLFKIKLVCASVSVIGPVKT